MRRIVLTGGPCAGKSVISRAVADHFADQLVHVPEAATAVYSRRGQRRDRLAVPERRAVQHEIYALQLEQEAQVVAAFPERAMMLDRGTLDGACYWPGGVDDYWPNMRTTRERELARYDAVIWLESAAALGLYDGDASNPVRWEDAREAMMAGEMMKMIWAGHPRLFSIAAAPMLDDKVRRVVGHVAALLAENK